MSKGPDSRETPVLNTDFRLFTGRSRATDGPEVPSKRIMCASYPKRVTDVLCTCFIF